MVGVLVVALVVKVAASSREWPQLHEVENGTHGARGTSDGAFDSEISGTRLRVVGVENGEMSGFSKGAGWDETGEGRLRRSGGRAGLVLRAKRAAGCALRTPERL